MTTFRLFALLFTLTTLLCAQSPAAQHKTVSLRYLFLDESSGAYSIKIGPRFHNLGPTPYVISTPQELPAGERIELYKELPDPETGESVRTRVLNRAAPPGLAHALVVIAPASAATADGAAAYRARFFDTDPARTPSRSIRILNLSPAPMAARFGAEEVRVPAGDTALLQPATDARGRLRTFIGVDVQGPDGWKVIYNSFVSLRENQRMTGIVVYSPSGLRHTYSEDELRALGPPKPGHFWLTFTESI